MIIQFSSTIPVITPRGKALAIGWIDYGVEHDLMWICIQDSTGECWTWKNPEVRAQINITHGREHISPFYNPADVAFKGYSSYAPDVPITPEDSKPASQQLSGKGKVFVEKYYGGEPQEKHDEPIAYEWKGKVIISNEIKWIPWSHSMPKEGSFLFKDDKGRVFKGEHKYSKLRGNLFIEFPSGFQGQRIVSWYQEDEK